MTTNETVALTRAQIEDLRRIIHDADSPLGNRLQDVSSRLYFALEGAGWTPTAAPAPAGAQQAASEEKKCPACDMPDGRVAPCCEECPQHDHAPATDEKLGAVAYKGYDDYWTEHCAGRESEAWAASAKAVVAAYLATQTAAGARQAVARLPNEEATGKALQDVYMALAEVPCECSARRREEGVHLSGCHLFDLCAAIDALADIEALAATPAPEAAPSAKEGEAEQPAAVALRELVECKDLKNRLEGYEAGSTDELAELGEEYARRKPLAWAFARKVLEGNPGPRILWPDMLEAEARASGALAGSDAIKGLTPAGGDRSA